MDGSTGKSPIERIVALFARHEIRFVLVGGQSVRMNEFDVRIIALEDLIRIKEYLGRPKDREALLQLKAIRRIRAEQSE